MTEYDAKLLWVVDIRDSCPGHTGCCAMVCLITCAYASLFLAVVRAQLLYDVLGVRQDASQGEIKQAYKKLARQWYSLSSRQAVKQISQGCGH